MTEEREKKDLRETDDDGFHIIDELDDEENGIEEVDSGMDDPGSEGAAPGVEDELRALRSENQELKDSYLRLRADFENYRKRLDREKTDYYRFALSGVVSEILPVLDNFERALSSVEAPDSEFVRGVEMIQRQLADILQKLGLEEVQAHGAHFDPNLHEAVVRDEDPALPNNTVTEVLQKGYSFQDRLLRPAMVKVATGGPDSDAAVSEVEQDPPRVDEGEDESPRSES